MMVPEGLLFVDDRLIGLWHRFAPQRRALRVPSWIDATIIFRSIPFVGRMYFSGQVLSAAAAVGLCPSAVSRCYFAVSFSLSR